MQPNRDKLRITVYPPSAPSGSDDLSIEAADEAVAILARLIGRQIAREQFQRRVAAECRSATKAKGAGPRS